MLGEGNVSENLVMLNATDGCRIFGTLTQGNLPRALVIFVHGLTGDRDYHLYHRAARTFPALGFDTFRYDLFSNAPGGRTLTDCSLSIFAADLSLVLQHFSSYYKQIHVIGHSIGGAIAMLTDQSHIASLVLWDTGLNRDPKARTPFEFSEQLGLYVARLKIEYLLSPELIRERSELDERLLARLQSPVKLIFASNTKIRQSWQDLLDKLPVPHEAETIEGAGHGFSEWGVDERLFELTLSWINRQTETRAEEGTR
ncbi:MAG: alpha/beta fold hydrolase [Pseudomonadota bacterium]